MKKLMSVLLAVAMCLSLSAPASAAEETIDGYEAIVVFSAFVQENGIQTVKVLSNEDRIQQAKESVLALGLSDMGLGYIEEACLSELTAYAEDDSIILEEYKVLIPKTRATDPVFLKRYRGYDFYCATTSEA